MYFVSQLPLLFPSRQFPPVFWFVKKKKKRKNDISTRPKARLVENQTVFLPKHCAMHGCLNFSRCSTRTTNFRRFDVASVCHTVIPNLRITADESERKISDFNMIKFTLNRLGKNLISKSLPKEFSLVVIEIFRNFSIERKIVWRFVRDAEIFFQIFRQPITIKEYNVIRK